MKYLLLISPDNHSIYSDILTELQKRGFSVDFLPDRMLNYDPDNVRAPFHMPRFLFSKLSERYWLKKLNERAYTKNYDYLLVVDGLGLNPIVFDILRKRNPNVYCVNYLYDTISGVYRFDRMFSYYDKVYSFDKEECIKYGLEFLPIFWVPLKIEQNSFFFFGFGGYNEERYRVYRIAKDYSDTNKRKSYIGLYIKKIKNEKVYALKRRIRQLLKLPVYLSLDRYHDPLLTNTALTPEEFRDKISCSEIIVDTHPRHQSGLTARFMWALGARKKIVTTNNSINQYEFYSKDQIFVLPNDCAFGESFSEFVKSPLVLSTEIDKQIDRIRIDNWISTVLSLKS